MSPTIGVKRPPPLDLLIRGGELIDGTGAAARRADVGVAHGRIVLGAALKDRDARTVIDAAGRIVAPGFIDIHAHSDFTALLYRRADSRVLAGVTTDVSGNCGASAFPLLGETLHRCKVEYEPRGLQIDWQQADEFFDRAASTPSSINRIVLLGHGNVRGAVIGYADRRATAGELQQMARIVEQCLGAGAWGLSTGLIYAPGCFADTAELSTLARVAAEHGGLYASHIRGEEGTVLQAVEEFFTVLSRSGARGQLSHLKVAGPRNWHLFEPLKRRLFEAYNQGVAFRADRYPYTASSTSLAATLLPEWARAGKLEQILTRLTEPATRRRICHHIQTSLEPDLPERLMICEVRSQQWQRAAGKRLAQVARDHGRTPAQTGLDLIVADQAQTTCVTFSMDEQQLREILTWPFVMIGSDGSIRDGLGPGAGQRCHPRAYGTPARFLGSYVRQLGLLSWPEAIAKMTSMPAEVLRLCDRGRIADGLVADLVIFNPRTIADRATYDCPAAAPDGIEHVIVNGQVVVQQGRHTGRYPGQILRYKP